MPVRTLAYAFALLVGGVDRQSRDLPALATIRDAMRAHPDLVAGEGRIDTLLMRAVPGLVTKAGAEGVHATGDPKRGIGIVVKIEDGARRALGPAVTSTLEGLGVIGEIERKALAKHAGERIRNAAGIDVGEIRGVARLEGLDADRHTERGA
jgi:L-asparaginase II